MDGYGKLRDDGPSSDAYSQPTYAQPTYAQPTYNNNNNNSGGGYVPPGMPQPGFGAPGPNQVGFNVPVQVGFGGYNQNVAVPVNFSTDGYGQAGQFVQNQFGPGGTAGHLPPGRWSDGLFSCDSSMSICILTVLCPCIQFGLMVKRAFPESGFVKPAGLFLIFMVVFWFGWAIGGWSNEPWLFMISAAAYCPFVGLIAWYRKRLRDKYDIAGLLVWDFLISWPCWLCSVCQMARHVERDYAMPV